MVEQYQSRRLQAVFLAILANVMGNICKKNRGLGTKLGRMGIADFKQYRLRRKFE